MIILGIETSCDETSAAVLSFDSFGFAQGKSTQDRKSNVRIQILSNIVSSSAKLQEKYGGILPEEAAREQVKIIIPVIEESLQVSGYRLQEINAIAVTYGPGLIGSLLVGVETAKTLAKVWSKPLIPVNHLLGHFYANWIIERSKIKNQRSKTPDFPAIGLLVSGGHTDLVYFKGHHDFEHLGGTRDDAAGECFDKCARLLGLPYPGGPQVSKLAQKGNPQAFDLPRPMIDSKNFDFSFSGLKTAFANLLAEYQQTAKSRAGKNGVQLSAQPIIGNSRQLLGAKQTSSERAGSAGDFFSRDELSDLSASLEQAIVDVLVTKVTQAAKKYNVKQIMLAGGVASNEKLRSEIRLKIKNLVFHQKIREGEQFKIQLSIPDAKLCTDNAAMIAARAFFEKPLKNPLDLKADPSLSLVSSSVYT